MLESHIEIIMRRHRDDSIAPTYKDLAQVALEQRELEAKVVRLRALVGCILYELTLGGKTLTDEHITELFAKYPHLAQAIV